MALHKLPKHYHPDFRLPNKKPVGGVDVDWGSPESESLVLSVIRRHGDPVEVRDFTKFSKQSLNTSVTAVGDYLNFNASSSQIRIGRNSALEPKNITIVVKCRISDSANTYSTIITKDKDNWSAPYYSYHLRVRHDTQNRVEFLVGNGTGFSGIQTADGSFNPYYGSDVYIVASYDGTTSRITVYNSDLKKILASTGTPSLGDIGYYNTDLCVGSMWTGILDGIRSNSRVYELFLLSKGLDEQDGKKFLHNRYNSLKPQNDPVYFTSDAVGGDTLHPTFIPTQELFYQPVVTRLLQSIEPSSIATSEVFYTHTVSPQSTGIAPQFIASGESVYTPDVTLLLKFIDVTHIPSEEVFYSPVVSNTLQTIAPLFTLSEEVFFRATVIGGDTIAIPIPDRATWQRVASYLSTLPYQGNNNDILVQWLIGEGYEDSFNDGFNSYLEDNGYEGSLADKLAEWKKG